MRSSSLPFQFPVVVFFKRNASTSTNPGSPTKPRKIFSSASLNVFPGFFPGRWRNRICSIDLRRANLLVSKTTFVKTPAVKRTGSNQGVSPHCWQPSQYYRALTSGVTIGVIQGDQRGQLAKNSEKRWEMIVNLWMSWMFILDKKNETPRKTQETTNKEY